MGKTDLKAIVDVFDLLAGRIRKLREGCAARTEGIAEETKQNMLDLYDAAGKMIVVVRDSYKDGYSVVPDGYEAQEVAVSYYRYVLERVCKDFSADSPDPVKAAKGAALNTVYAAIATLQEERGLESVAFTRDREE